MDRGFFKFDSSYKKCIYGLQPLAVHRTFSSVSAQPRCISKNALFYQKNDAFRQQIQPPNMLLITPNECSLCLTNLSA